MFSLFNGMNRRVGDLVRSLQAILPDEEFLRLMEYVEHNEHGLALEHLCDVFFEQEISCTADTLRKIEELGTRMRMDPAIWTKLKA
jgi:hypothetical protein